MEPLVGMILSGSDMTNQTSRELRFAKGANFPELGKLLAQRTLDAVTLLPLHYNLRPKRNVQHVKKYEAHGKVFLGLVYGLKCPPL